MSRHAAYTSATNEADFVARLSGEQAIRMCIMVGVDRYELRAVLYDDDTADLRAQLKEAHGVIATRSIELGQALAKIDTLEASCRQLESDHGAAFARAEIQMDDIRANGASAWERGTIA